MLKPPNYLFERDHKIVCGKEDFLKILCKLRDEKNKEMSEVSNYCTNNCNEKLNLISTIKTDTLKKNVQRRDEEVKSFFGSKPEFKATSSRLNTGHVDNFSDRNSHSYTLKNFMMKSGIKSQDQTKREHQLEQINQITRGKRDNVQKLVLSEPKKKLTLDEKLEKFASSVKKLKNRRKRLFELSRDRFHKTKTQCSDKYKRRSSMGASYPGGCYVKMAPPKFFFSNDKYIIHTTGSLQIILNSTCRSNEVEQESTLSVEQNKCTKSAENETQDLERNNIKKLRNNINQESQNYEIIQENSRNLNSRSKIGRTNCKKKKKLQDKLQSDIFKESIISKSGKLRLKNLPERDENKLKICNDNEKQITNTVTENKETEENNEKQIEINGPADDVDYLQKAKNSRLHIKYIRNFFAENDKEKNLSRHKMKNCISTKSRERPKDLPQIVNNYNKAEFESGQRLHKNKLEKYYGDELKKKKQGLCYEVANKNKGITFDEEGEKEDRSHTLNLSNLERKNLRSKQESASSSEMYSTESIENLMQNLRLKKHFGKNNAKLQCPKSRITGNQKKHFHSALEWELKEKHSRSHFPNKNSRQQVGSADFNFDINRKPFPEFVKPHFCLKEDPQMRFHSNSHSEDGINFANKIPILKSRQQPLLLNKTPRKYLILEKDKAIENPRDICFLPNALNSVPRVKGDHAPKNQLGDEFDSRKPQITQKKYQAYLRGRPSKNYYDTVKNYNALRKELAKAKRARQNLLIDPTKKAEVDVLNNMPPRRWNNFKSEKIFRPLSNADRTSENSDLRAAKSKRMVKYNFEPARGLGLKSELDIAVGEHQTLDKDQKIIEKLDNSSFVKKVKTRTCAEQRSKDTANSEKSDNIYVMSDTVWSKNKLSCYKNKSKSFEKEKRKKKSEKDKERLIRSYANAPDYVANNAMKDYKWKRQQSEQSKENPSRIQENSEKDAYAGEYVQDTAHCMRFGDLWYSVYLIKKPVVAQIVGIQLFDKHELCDGTTQWRDLTKGKMIRYLIIPFLRSLNFLLDIKFSN